jgi:hypothetical protein
LGTWKLSSGGIAASKALVAGTPPKANRASKNRIALPLPIAVAEWAGRGVYFLGKTSRAGGGSCETNGGVRLIAQGKELFSVKI